MAFWPISYRSFICCIRIWKCAVVDKAGVEGSSNWVGNAWLHQIRQDYQARKRRWL